MRDFRDAGDVQERSRVVNSLAAQEFGADATDPYGVQGGGIGFDLRGVFGARLRLDLSLERQRPLAIRATPSQGVFPRILPATPLRATRVSLFADRPTALSLLGTEVRATGELRLSRLSADDASVPLGANSVLRAFTSISIERPFEHGRLALQTLAGAVRANGDNIPAQEALFFGGPVSAPGYAFHELATSAGVSQRLEWRTPIPAPSIALGRFGRVPGQATLAPFVQGTLLRRFDFDGLSHATGVYPSVGMALQPFYDLLRVQVARGLRNGRWSFDVDVSKEFWGVL
jgi:hypothetical protein